MFLTCAHLNNYKLGNAMFIYAALRSKTSQMNWDLKLPTGTKLDVFTSLNYTPLTQQDANQLTYMYKELWFHYCSAFERLPPFGTTEAYFQSEKYFLNIRDKLLNEFVISTEKEDEVFKFLAPFKNYTKIAVHVRRGDYVNYPDYHPMLPINYYVQAEKALEAMNVENKVFIVCSDSISWCKENLKFTTGNIIYSENFSDVQDLVLMQHCDHNIIANSSFSWWSAWLNNNPNKIVIGPQTRNPKAQQWFAHKGPQDTQDLYPESWIEV